MITPIRFFRMQRGLTCSALARLAGIPTSTLRRYDRGEREPNLRVLRQVAAALELPPGSLVDREVKVTTGDVAQTGTNATGQGGEHDGSGA